jgi:hypothetical protein
MTEPPYRSAPHGGNRRRPERGAREKCQAFEEAVLLLEEGRTAEVKVLAKELTKVFDSKGVHREALGALKLFKEAAEQEAATAELARRVLSFLFRARHDEGLRFTAE